MMNGTPPKVCLADFEFTTVVLDLRDLISSSPTLEGDATAIMASEPLAPSRVGLENVVPTQEGDIRSFGLAIFRQSCCAATYIS
jgi:hypothetical protein